MIFYLRNGDRLVVTAAPVAMFLLGSFLFGVLSVRRTTEGVMLIAALLCLIVYWVKPKVWSRSPGSALRLLSNPRVPTIARSPDNRGPGRPWRAG